VRSQCSFGSWFALPPTRTSDQPKVADGWITFGSAPCELRDRYVLLYDCKPNLSRVETITDTYQGSLIEPNASPAQ
jgi:hypothetical protein